MKKIVGLLFLFTACVLFSAPTLYAQGENEERERIFLISAKSAETFEKYGIPFRRVIGPARFLHNNTYILCDTAIINSHTEVLDAINNVEIIQDGVHLYGDRIHYISKQNLAEIRGRVVELVDKDSNRLRTQYLDFNTKDSIGHFFNGGAMVDSKGNIMESRTGWFESKRKLFRFYEDVEMSTDTVLIKSDSLFYHTDTNLAEFWSHIQAWHTNGFLKAERGQYYRKLEDFHFFDNVYIQSDHQQAWADEVNYDRLKNTALLRHNVQIKDTSQSVIFMGNRAFYRSDPLYAELTDSPAAVTWMEDDQTHRIDSIFMRADTLRYYRLRLRDIDSLTLAAAKARTPKWEEDTTATAAKQPLPPPEATDSVSTTAAIDTTALHAARMLLLEKGDRQSRKAFKAAEKAVEKAKAQAWKDSVRTEREAYKASRLAAKQARAAARLARRKSGKPRSDTLAVPRDSITVPLDSLKEAALDSLPPMPKDSLPLETQLWRQDSLSIEKDFTSYTDSVAKQISAIGDSLLLDTQQSFLEAWHRVKIYKSNLQSYCDSLVFNSIDSLIRMFGAPVLWNEQHQFSSDSVHFLLRGGALREASFYANAFIASQQDKYLFNQIKSKDMYAWFRDNDIYKYQSMGTVSAIFYLAEDSLVTMANVKECQDMTVYLKKRRAQRIVYKGQIKSDAYPLFAFSKEKQQLKDFRWRSQDRPASRYDITPLPVLEMSPQEIAHYRKPVFPITKRYFPRHMSLYASKRKEAPRTLARDETPLPDSPPAVRDDSLQTVPAPHDGLFIAPHDSLIAIPRDSLLPLKPTPSLKDTVPAEKAAVPIPDPTREIATQALPATQPTSPQDALTSAIEKQDEKTIGKTGKMSRAEKKALRQAKRKARAEARAARKAARKAKREARRVARRAARMEARALRAAKKQQQHIKDKL